MWSKSPPTVWVSSATASLCSTGTWAPRPATPTRPWPRDRPTPSTVGQQPATHTFARGPSRPPNPQRRRVEALRNVQHHRGGARAHAADQHLHAGDVMGRLRQQPPAGTAESRVRSRSARAQRRHRQHRALRHARRPRCRNHQRDVVVDLGTYAKAVVSKLFSRASKAGTGSNAASPASIASSVGSRPTTSGPAGTSGGAG